MFQTRRSHTVIMTNHSLGKLVQRRLPFLGDLVQCKSRLCKIYLMYIEKRYICSTQGACTSFSKLSNQIMMQSKGNMCGTITFLELFFIKFLLISFYANIFLIERWDDYMYFTT